MKPLFNNFFPPNVVTYVSDRCNDFVFDQDRKSFSEEQIKSLKSKFDFLLPDPVNIMQVHGSNVVMAKKQFAHQVYEADGLVTNETQLPLVIRTADCLPIFMYDSFNQCVGLIHAGWRSSQLNIVVIALDLMKSKYNTRPENLKIAFGPAIQVKHYQVGKEFKAYFPNEIFKRSNDYYLDIPLVNKNQLKKAGVLEQNIFDCGICTYQDSHYFSYRREGI